MDYEEKCRSFQDKEMSYDALLDQVLRDYQGGMHISGRNHTEQPVGRFLLQYRETDWEFCKRLATHFQTQLVADALGKAPRFCFGLPKNKGTLIHVDDVVTRRDVRQYQEAVSNGFSVIEGHFIKYDIQSKGNGRYLDGVVEKQ